MFKFVVICLFFCSVHLLIRVLPRWFLHANYYVTEGRKFKKNARVENYTF